MGRYDSPEAVYEELGAVLGNVLGNEDRLRQLWKADSIFRLQLTEPEATITCSAKAGMRPSLVTGGEDLAVDLTFAMPADTAYGLLSGELSAPVTLASGQVALKGPVPKLLQVLEGLVRATEVEPGTSQPAEVPADSESAAEDPGTDESPGDGQTDDEPPGEDQTEPGGQ